jgi:hypothetical protein
MANIQPVYAATATTLTVSGLLGLANGSSATSANVTNTAYLDVLIFAQITTGSGALATGVIEVYAAGSADGVYFDTVGNDKWIGTMPLVSAGTQVVNRVMSIASSFGGTLPPFWRIRFRNSTGAAFNGTGCSASYRGVSAQTV